MDLCEHGNSHNDPLSKPGQVSQGVVSIQAVDSLFTLPSEWERVIGAWLGWLTMRSVSKDTIRVRRAVIRMIARRSGAENPAQLTRAGLLALCGAASWSAEYRKLVRSSLLSFYEWGVAEGLLAENVAECLPSVKVPPPNPRPAPDRIWQQLLASARPRESLMALLACQAGLRRAEVAGLHRDDLIADLGGWSLRIRGKGGKQRVVPITDELARHVMSFQAGGYLFPGKVDGHVSPHHVGKLISALMPPGWTMHKLRHRYATRGYAGTGNLRAVQLALGHSSVATTERYTAVSSRDVRAVSEAAGNVT